MILFFSIFSIFLLIFVLSEMRKPKNYPPGPTFVPIIGNLYKLKNYTKNLGGLHLAFSKLAEIYKTDLLGLKLGNELTIIAHDLTTIKKILFDEIFDGRPDNFFMRLRTMGTRKGITGTDGEFWKIQRNAVVKYLKKLGLGKESISKYIENEIEDLIEKLPEESEDLKTFLARYVLIVLCNLTSGSTLKKEDSRIMKLLKLLSERSKAFGMAGSILNLFPWLRFIIPKQSGYELIMKMNEELDNFFEETLDEHYRTWSEDKNTDLIYMYITDIKNGHDETFTKEQLKMVLLDLFIAGSQTTSTTIDFAIMMMILKPEIQEKVQKMLDKEFNKEERINYFEKQRVPYVEAILMEVMRYFLITPLLGPRRVLENTTLNGYMIPKNTTVLMNTCRIYKDKTLWKDPDNFRPERFIDENGDLISFDYFISFGLGRRRCLGDALAKNCLFTLFAEILRKYKITLQPNSEPPSLVPLPGLVLTPKPYSAKFIKR